MTKQEFAYFVMAMQSYFTKERNLLPDEQAIELWYLQLKDLDYKVAEAALNKWAATNKWSPTIADIRELAADFTMGELPDWSEAWEQVQLAARRYGFYRAGEAINSLSPLARKTVERLGFREICYSENQDALRANFRDIYKSLAEREKKQAQLPEGLKQLIGQMQQEKLLEG